MLARKDIEDALIEDVKANITGVKTCDTHEDDFDEQTLRTMVPLSPFVLIRYGGTDPDEDQRMANGASGMNKREFYLAIGAQTFRSKKESQRGAYSLLDDLELRYNGRTITVNDSSVTFGYGGDRLLFKVPGLVVYFMILKWTED